MVRQDIYSQEGELTMSLPVGEVSATVGAPSMDVDRRRLQEEIVDLLGEGVYRFDSRRRRSSPTARRPPATCAKTQVIEKRGRRNEWMMMTRSPVIARIRDWVLERSPEDRLRQVAAEMATGE